MGVTPSFFMDPMPEEMLAQEVIVICENKRALVDRVIISLSWQAHGETEHSVGSNHVEIFE